MRIRNIVIAAVLTLAAFAGLWTLAMRYFFGSAVSIGIIGGADGPTAIFISPESGSRWISIIVIAVLVLIIMVMQRRKRTSR